MLNKEKIYYYEMPLSETLIKQLREFADEHNEAFNVCIQRTLEKGLLTRIKGKQNFKTALYRALEETENGLRRPL